MTVFYSKIRNAKSAVDFLPPSFWGQATSVGATLFLSGLTFFFLNEKQRFVICFLKQGG